MFNKSKVYFFPVELFVDLSLSCLDQYGVTNKTLSPLNSIIVTNNINKVCLTHVKCGFWNILEDILY